MKNDWRNNQLPPPDSTDDRPDGFISVAILAFVLVAPLIFFGPQLGAVEAWFVDIYLIVDQWIAPLRELFFGDGR